MSYPDHYESRLEHEVEELTKSIAEKDDEIANSPQILGGLIPTVSCNRSSEKSSSPRMCHRKGSIGCTDVTDLRP
jgi:hypothetical protein